MIVQSGKVVTGVLQIIEFSEGVSDAEDIL